MALNLQVSARTPITVPLAADPALVEANPPRADGTIPHLRYIMSGDCEGLVIPAGVSTATIRGLTKDEFRDAEAAAGRMSDKGRRVYLRVTNEVRKRADAKDATALRKRAEALMLAALRIDSGDVEGEALEALQREVEAETEAIRDAELAAEKPATEAAVLDDASDADVAAYEGFQRWHRMYHREVARRGLLALSDCPDIEPGPKGYPVEALLQDDNGEAVIDEVARHIEHAGTLGKAPPLSSGCSSGVSEAASASTTSAPPEMTATAGSVPDPAPASAAVS